MRACTVMSSEGVVDSLFCEKGDAGLACRPDIPAKGVRVLAAAVLVEMVIFGALFTKAFPADDPALLLDPRRPSLGSVKDITSSGNVRSSWLSQELGPRASCRQIASVLTFGLFGSDKA